MESFDHITHNLFLVKNDDFAFIGGRQNAIKSECKIRPCITVKYVNKYVSRCHRQLSQTVPKFKINSVPFILSRLV